MKTEEVKTLLEAQMPESGQYIKPFVEDEHEGPGPGPTLQCSSPEYKALYVAWPFKAPPRGQTSMPLFIARLIDGLPTAEERTDAKLLWNRSLPVAANVGIIEYNRVDGPVFREKMGNRYGEGWCRALENLARYALFGVIVSCLVANFGSFTAFLHTFEGLSPLFCTTPWVTYHF